jgi:hypothetical protein
MKKVLLFGVLSLMFLINACGPDEPQSTTTTLNLNFQGVYDNDTDFAFFKYYDYQNGDSVFINVARFYISDITLIRGSDETKIKDISVLDFSNNHAIPGDNPETIVIENIPAGQYTGIRFGIGVDSVLNHTIPADYEAGHPLANASEYWDWRETYIFGKFEGRLKKGDGTTISYAYHPGTNLLYRIPNLSKIFTLEADIAADLNFKVNFGQLFNQGNDKIDIKTTPISHTGDADLWLVTQLMDNLESAFTVE